MNDDLPVGGPPVTMSLCAALQLLEDRAWESGLVSMSEVAIAIYPVIPLMMAMELELRRIDVDRAAGADQRTATRG